jgi:inosine-uridine nucleoside N-ribohydrolase
MKKSKEKPLFKLVLVLILSASCSLTFSSDLIQTDLPPQRVILDTDIDSDVDDTGALAMLLNLHKKGIIELLGIITTSDDPYAPVCVSAITTYYGCSEIPVGFLMGQHTLTNHSRYTKFIADEFPSKLSSWSMAEVSTTLYRKLLAQIPDESVIIITIGHLSSLMRLLQSPSDKISRIDGMELAAKKVTKWICMGGEYPKGKEANFGRPDPGSTVYCLNHWDKEIIFCGWEAGSKVITGGSNLKSLLKTGHPVYRAYELYNNFEGRSSWDQIAVLQLTGMADKYFSFSRNGRCEVKPDGSNKWRDDPSCKQKYVRIRPSVKIKDIEYYIDNLISGA